MKDIRYIYIYMQYKNILYTQKAYLLQNSSYICRKIIGEKERLNLDRKIKKQESMKDIDRYSRWIKRGRGGERGLLAVSIDFRGREIHVRLGQVRIIRLEGQMLRLSRLGGRAPPWLGRQFLSSEINAHSCQQPSERKREKRESTKFCLWGSRQRETEVVQTLYITLSILVPIRLPPEPNFRFVLFLALKES